MAVATRARRLRRADLSFAAAAALALARGARADCLTGSACTLIAANPADPAHTWTWSLASLCNNGRGYNFNNGTTQYRFEICGSIDPVVPALPACVGDGVTPCNVAGAQTNTYCNPEYNAYPNAGNFLHFFDPNPQTSCTYGPTSGTPAPGSAGGCPNVGGPSSATFNLPDLCCTGQVKCYPTLHPLTCGRSTPQTSRSGSRGRRPATTPTVRTSTGVRLSPTLDTHDLASSRTRCTATRAGRSRTLLSSTRFSPIRPARTSPPTPITPHAERLASAGEAQR